MASRVDPPSTILGRTLTLSSAAKTVCLIAESFLTEWRQVIAQLWSINVVPLRSEETVAHAVQGQIEAIRQREATASIILMPHNHCAVDEPNWIEAARGALRLASCHRNTVYFLHDRAENDPRAAKVRPPICTSSVVVGSATVLAAMFAGKHRTNIVDLVVGAPEEAFQAVFTVAIYADNPMLNAVHVRLVEEYARLHRGDVWHRSPRQLDLHA